MMSIKSKHKKDSIKSDHKVNEHTDVVPEKNILTLRLFYVCIAVVASVFCKFLFSRPL
jgi:hypothetical protein